VTGGVSHLDHPAVTDLRDHLGEVEAAAAKLIDDPVARTLLVKSIGKLSKRLADRAEATVVQRYADTGGDPRRAVRGPLAPASQVGCGAEERSRAVQRLVAAGWMQGVQVGSDELFLFAVGEPLAACRK